jgi:hypothetical protein
VPSLAGIGEKLSAEKPYRPGQNRYGGDFWKTLFVKVSAMTWREQGQELMILEMCCQVGFSRCVFLNEGVP